MSTEIERTRAMGEVRALSDRQLDVLIARMLGKAVVEGPARQRAGTDFYVSHFGAAVTGGDIRRQQLVPHYTADADANDAMHRFMEAQAAAVRARYRAWIAHFSPGPPTLLAGSLRARAEAGVLAHLYEVSP
ncbi:MAG TPA: hypothetical protein VHG93_24585 [Longimicrobium sp.]|nr:hypothetical protein [Longimicrobium sp.]